MKYVSIKNNEKIFKNAFKYYIKTVLNMIKNNANNGHSTCEIRWGELFDYNIHDILDNTGFDNSSLNEKQISYIKSYIINRLKELNYIVENVYDNDEFIGILVKW